MAHEGLAGPSFFIRGTCSNGPLMCLAFLCLLFVQVIPLIAILSLCEFAVLECGFSGPDLTSVIDLDLRKHFTYLALPMHYYSTCLLIKFASGINHY